MSDKQKVNNPYTGMLVFGDGTSKKGKMILEYKDGFDIRRLWRFDYEEESTYMFSTFLGKPLFCTECGGNITPCSPLDFNEECEDGCSITFDDALKLFKKTNPDITKDWFYCDPHVSLECALAELTGELIRPKSKHFKSYRTEIDKIQDDGKRKVGPEYNAWVELMEKEEPGFTNY